MVRQSSKRFCEWFLNVGDNIGNFNVKSIILGIGIGIVVTATASMIYIAGSNPAKELSEQQIIDQAEKLGMVKSSSLFNGASVSESAIEGTAIIYGNELPNVR